MIVAVKKRDKKNKNFKIIIVIALILGIFFLLFKVGQSISLKNEQEKIELSEKIALDLENEKKEQDRENAQRVILVEIEKVVELIGQKNIENIQIIENKVVYTLKPNTNIDAITIRYGAIALIKRSFKEIVIVVDLEYILKDKLK